MLVIAGQIAFWFSTFALLLGCLTKNVMSLRRVLLWQPPASLTDHNGSALPTDCQFFAIPAINDQLLYSAEVTLHRPVSLLTTFLLACMGVAFGLAWGFVGVWLSSIEPGVLKYLLLSICAAIFALESFRHWTPACMTYVCADRFGFVTTKLTGSGKYYDPSRTQETSYELGSIDGANPLESDLVLNLNDGKSSRIVTIRRPHCLTDQHWQQWVGAIRETYEQLRWTESLFHLALYAPRCRDLPFDITAPTAVRFDVLSVLTERTTDGSDFVRCPDGRLVRLPTGRLGFAEGGLIFENFAPLYDSLNRIDSLSLGVHIASHVDDASKHATEVTRIVECWRSDHVRCFPLATIESFHDDPDFCTIRLRDGKELEFQRAQIVGYPTFCGLIHSAIWQFGIEEELRRQLVQDVTRLQETGVGPELTNPIFGRYLPKHRALLWDVAYRLRVSTSQSGERADELTRHAFHDSQRLLKKHTGRDNVFLDEFLGWEGLNSDSACPEAVTDTAASQELDGSVEEVEERPRSQSE